ncbi:MAG: FxsA family protein [Pseudomonadota bacterium]
MWLLIPFIAIPMLEIALFISVGGALGLWPTLAIVLLTALLGSWLMRREGQAALAELGTAFETGGDPAAPLAHGALILVAGVLLITPGFFTDAVGLSLMLAPIRSLLLARVGPAIAVRLATRRRRSATMGEPMGHPGRTSPDPGIPIDAEIIEDEVAAARQDDASPRPGVQGSGWTKPPK